MIHRNETELFKAAVEAARKIQDQFIDAVTSGNGCPTTATMAVEFYTAARLVGFNSAPGPGYSLQDLGKMREELGSAGFVQKLENLIEADNATLEKTS